MEVFTIRAEAPGSEQPWAIVRERSGEIVHCRIRAYAIDMACEWARKHRPSRVLVQDENRLIEHTFDYAVLEARPGKVPEEKVAAVAVAAVRRMSAARRNSRDNRLAAAPHAAREPAQEKPPK